ncbi:MAG: serine/threonine-protein kinase, partial [Acidobacteriota bacterium]
IKLLHPELASSDLVRRFRRERQILARLEHPNIARFIGGGTTDDGRPYLVMQHVDGVPIDQWCAENAPGVDARLRLFCRVCAAVQAAHQNLVVHRDLKPSNILVDANGEPKLLDFGIAKALTPEHEDRFRDIPTAGPLLMTPRYASPEQVRGHTVTTATDVHALGLLLYELLTGSHPFGSGRSSEILNRIESSQPEPPSRRVQRDLPRGEDRSPEDSGGGMKRPSHRRLTGDLDAIVLRALAKDPEARYASAAELEQDVRRHLEHWPVQARRPTPSYLASRFIRRHRLATGAAALVLVLILGFSITALKLWKQAVYEKHRAQEVATFLEDIYPMPDPRRDDGSTVTALELLERSASSLDESLEDQPADRSVLLLAVGSAYHGLAHNEQAERFLIRGVELHRATVPGPSHRLVQGLFDLASVSRALGRPEAPTRLERALDELRAGGVDHPRLATLLNNHATLLRYGGDFATAEALQRDVLAMRIRLYGTGHENVATAWNNLGNTLRQRGRLDEAEAYLRRALAARIELLGKDSPRTLNTDNSLALVLRDRGELAAAESRLRANLASRRRLLGPDHPALGNVLSNLAGTRLMSGDPDEAEVLLEEAYRLFSAAYGAGHVNTGVVLRNQAAVRLAREEPTPESVAEATDLAGAAKDIFAGQFG